ncbi:hypothetical protein E4U56_008336 [Claviceps arundinis]|uniref:Protein kinase domain-containing protein n=1 Tax=Claviceps arundinis TaxID=1623583 RepID=A0A9P7MSP7_9HYPO|nr:hypothetical protein E4U56_008336 [Claviceps arundinis]
MLKGEFCAGISNPESKPLEQRETVLDGEDRDCFLRFMRKMLQWDPEKRSSAKELTEDEWVLKHYSKEAVKIIGSSHNVPNSEHSAIKYQGISIYIGYLLVSETAATIVSGD